MCVHVLDEGESLSFTTIDFGIKFCLKYHLSLITSVALGKLLIIDLAVPQFPCLKIGIHSVFDKCDWVPALFQALF